MRSVSRIGCVLVMAALVAWFGRLAFAEVTNVLPPLEADGSKPKGWTSAEPSNGWMLDRFAVRDDAGRRVMRVETAPAVIRLERRVEPAWGEVELSLQSRRAGVEAGANPWEAIIAEVGFLDASGKQLLDWQRSIWLKGDTNGQWEPVTKRYVVPAEAVTMEVVLGHKAKQGVADFTDVAVNVVAERPAAEQAAIRERMDAARVAREAAAAKAEAERRVVKQVDPSKVTGARTDESQIAVTLHVNAAVAAGGDGSQAKPFASFKAAVDAAVEQLKAAKPTKILIAPGVYREQVTLTGGELNQPLGPVGTTLLVIEGAEPGKVILSGSDVYAPAEWKAVRDDAGKVLYYEHAWPHDFGNEEGPWGQYNPQKLLGHRAEQVFVNGRPLRQVIVEDYEYVPGKGWGGKGQHNYKGFADPKTVLDAPGTFAVAERDENGNRLFVRPPEGVNWDGALIEVSTRRHVLHSHYKSNLVLRNLTIQHAASTHSTIHAALMIGHWHHEQKTLTNSDVLIENCRIQWNNGFGAKMGYGKNVTLRNFVAQYNGHSGINTGTQANVLIEDCDLSYNNWRGHLGDFYGWAVGGIKAHQTRDAVLRRVTAIGNMAPGIWFDVNNTNVTIDDCTVVANRRGLFLEISAGPFLVSDTLVAGDRHVALVLTNAANVTVRDSIFYGSAKHLISACTNDERGAGNGIEAALGIEAPVGGGGEVIDGSTRKVFRQGAADFRNNVFANPAGVLIMQDPSSPQLYAEWIKDLVTSEGNAWSTREARPFGVGYTNSQMVDLAGWREVTGEDATSQMTEPRFAAPAAFEFTLPGGHPVSGRSLKAARVVDPARVEQTRSFFAQFNYGGQDDYADDPLASREK